MPNHRSPDIVVTDRVRSCGAEMKNVCSAQQQEAGCWANNRAENSHQPFRRRERTMRRFRRTRTVSKFFAVGASVHNLFSMERALYSRPNFKLNRAAAFAEWRGLFAA